MNIITDPTSFEKGGKFKQKVRSGLLKTTFNYNTGLLLNNQVGASGTIVRKTGDGIIDGTWTDVEMLAGSKVVVSDKQRFELYLKIGAYNDTDKIYTNKICPLTHKS